MTATEKRQKVINQYTKILGRNIYSQNGTKRECCFVPYSDGKYYSDCSSSIRLAYKTANVGIPNIGSNTPPQWRNAAGKHIDAKIVNGIPMDISALRVGDCLYFAGTSQSRAYADFVGHVEMIYSISGNKVTLCGHGSGTPSKKEMKRYCKNRYATKAPTTRGNCGCIGVVRWIQDDPKTPVQAGKTVLVTVENLNVRNKPNIFGKRVAIVHAGERYEYCGTASTGWYAITGNGIKGYISNKYSIRE